MTTEEELREEVDDRVPDDIELFTQQSKKEGVIYGRDDHGEFEVKPMRGSAEPRDDRCGWPVRYYMERYGQKRYCTVMPESTFIDGGSDFCRIHKQADDLMEHHQELFKHGYFATNYVNFSKHLPPHKFLFAVEMVGGLFELSDHDFDVAEDTRTLDATDVEMIQEDAVEVTLPIPTNTMLTTQANELWAAALKEVMQQNMQEVIFQEGMQKQTLTASEGMEGQITDTHYESTEHHLHLPLSRVGKDIKTHLENGGVVLDDADNGAVRFQQNDYTLDISPKEIDSDGAEDFSEASADFSEHLTAEDDSEDNEIEVAVDE